MHLRILWACLLSAGFHSAQASPTDSEPAVCKSEQILLQQGPVDAGMSHVELTMVISNRGKTQCSLSGTPFVRLIAASGKAIGSSASFKQQSPLDRAKRISLSPGQRAHFTVSFGNSEPYPQAHCPGASKKVSVLMSGMKSQCVIELEVQACTRLKVSAPVLGE